MAPPPAHNPSLTQLTLTEGAWLPLEQRGTLPPQAHIFEQRSIDAVNAALAARRPLLVRGEPGTGKSQLARASAQGLKRPLITQLIDSRTEACDLLWELDAVARLAEAQLQAAVSFRGEPDAEARLTKLRAELAPPRFVRPGSLWWALNWQSALDHIQDLKVPALAPPHPEGWTPGDGTVLLIDEIDKGDADVPNGLLEALGEGIFRPPGFEESIAFDGGKAPLVIITTNEERALPNAFLRRCLVLRLALPELAPTPTEEQRKAFVSFLIERGRAHFGRRPPGKPKNAGGEVPQLSEHERKVLEQAALLLLEDRIEAFGNEQAPPGVAEYLDLLRAVREQTSDPDEQGTLVDSLREFTFQKQPPEHGA